VANQVEIARQLGLSQRSVSAALAGKTDVSEATRRRVREVADKIGYRPNAAARAMVNRRTRNIGVVVWATGGAPISLHETELVSGVHDILEPAGYTTCLIQMSDVERSGDGMTRVFNEQMLDGMVICCGLQQLIRERVGSLVDKIVWCDAGVHDATNCLWRDERLAGKLAGEAIVRAGYREAIWLSQLQKGGPRRTYTYASDRLTAFKKAAKDVVLHDMAILPELELPWKEFGALLKPGVAVLASTYAHATMSMLMASACGKMVGRDFGLACCDELAAWKYHWPNLARADFDRFGMGQQAGRMILQRLSEPKSAAESWVSSPTWHTGNDARTGLPSTLPEMR
jgi:DNA-binding LacI/PurR family transcriptional regulator